VVTAKDLTTWAPARISVTSTKGGVTRDTAVYVMVQPTAATATSLSIQPASPADTLLASGTYYPVTPVVAAEGGGFITGAFVLLSVKPSDTRLVTIDQQYQQFKPNAPGQAWIYGTAYVFGTVLRDSVFYTFGPPDNISVMVYEDHGSYGSVGADGTLLLAVNGTATFANYTPGPVEFTFDDTTGIVGGNISLDVYVQEPRQFTKPGLYTWRTNTTPVFTGKILVK
jgi:hypothetical protein